MLSWHSKSLVLGGTVNWDKVQCVHWQMCQYKTGQFLSMSKPCSKVCNLCQGFAHWKHCLHMTGGSIWEGSLKTDTTVCNMGGQCHSDRRLFGPISSQPTKCHLLSSICRLRSPKWRSMINNGCSAASLSLTVHRLPQEANAGFASSAIAKMSSAIAKIVSAIAKDAVCYRTRCCVLSQRMFAK